MLYNVSVFPMSIPGCCWRQGIALDEQNIQYNMKKHMIYGFESAFDLFKPANYHAHNFKICLGYLFCHTIYLCLYLDFFILQKAGGRSLRLVSTASVLSGRT